MELVSVTLPCKNPKEIFTKKLQRFLCKYSPKIGSLKHSKHTIGKINCTYTRMFNKYINNEYLVSCCTGLAGFTIKDRVLKAPNHFSKY